jgi:F0F1-type ATP synthase epsilon subunit
MSIYCNIFSPVQHQTSKTGDMILLNSKEGEIGILEGHMNLIIELKAGKVKILSNKSVIEEIETKEALAYIKSDRVDILEVL